MTRRSLPCASLLVAGLTLAGCSGGGSSPPSGVAPPSSAAASGPASYASTGTPGTSGSPGPAPGTRAAAAVDPCEVLHADRVSALTGVGLKKGTTQDVGGSKVCTWLPKDATKSDAALFSAQEGPLPGPLGQVEDQLKAQFDGKVSPLRVDGADDARYITGKKSGLNVIDVLAARDGTFYQVLVATPRDAAQHKKAAVRVAEALLEG